MINSITIRKSAILVFIVLWCQINAYCQNSGGRQTLPLNTAWKFSLSDNQEYATINYNDASWRELDIPHDWSIEGEINALNPAGGGGAFLPTGIGWYRKQFSLSDSLKSKRVIVQFDGVYMNSEVWINGNYLGQYPYGYTTFQYDLSEYLFKDKPNVLAVRVNNSKQPSSRWYAGSGIYRKVQLIVTNEVYFANMGGVFISTPNISDKEATVQLSYKILAKEYPETDFKWWRQNNELNKRVSKDFTVVSTVFDSKGNKLQTSSKVINIKDYSQTDLLDKIVVKNPSLWSSSNPVMYSLKSTLKIGNKIYDEITTKFGIRSIIFTPDKGMLVNGKQEKLKGVCIHQDAGSLGVAVPDDMWYYRLRKLKELGCNAIRGSHHPFPISFYNMCDTMGFYVMDEIFDEWNKGLEVWKSDNPTGKVQAGYHLYFNQWAETDLRAMIKRDRNHPSIIMYSIGNEIPNQRDVEGKKIAAWLTSICKSEDSTRLTTVASDYSREANENGFLEEVDIAGYNYIDRFGGDLMYDIDKQKYPNRLFLGTETYHTKRYWLAARDKNYVMGEFVWSGFDYLGESSTYPKFGWDAGLIDISGAERPEYYLRKSIWSTKPVIYIAIDTKQKPETDWHPKPYKSHWNWQYSANYLTTINVFSNCDEIELWLNDALISKKENDKNSYITVWEIPYTPGKLKAIGYKNGQKVTEYQIQTAGQPYQFVAKTTKNTLQTNTDDLSIIELSITDEKGVPVPDSSIPVTIKTEGVIKLIGFDSGNLTKPELLQSNTRTSFNGRLLAVLKEQKIAGKAKVTFSAKGIKPLTLEIDVVNK